MMASRGESQTETDRTSESSELSVEKSPSQFTLNVNILRFRAVAIPVAMAGFFVGVTLPFAEDGIQVGFFRSIDLDETARKDLHMVVAVIFLIYAAKMGVYFESRRRYLMMGAIGVVGYLMNTGFNSLNLQVVPGRVHPRIASADLAVENVQDHAQDVDANGFLTTTWDTKFREDTPGNSVLNIIFRNLFISMEDVPTWCDSIDDYLVPFKEVFASYGFPSRSWQQRVLSKALEPTGVLSMPMNAAASDLPPDEELPMSVGNATNLAAYAMIILPRKFKTRDSSLTTFMLSEDASCERMVDKYLNHIEKNHLYIEHTLQPAYTAGLYFILQNAVVLKQINASDIPLATSLEFSGNILDMHIRASIPTTSMTFAFFGCFIMVLGGVAIAFLSKHAEAALLKRNTATIAAEALDNPEKYPPFMLRLQLRDCSTGKAADVEYNSLCVDSVVLVSNQDKTQQFAIGTRRA
ncbi:hypothetical protein PF001_g27492 [Phytophthora fragariae]|uniref:Uncharacterized protein n=1 Tax=Phytophthora fragariae TaxID=53985 RepID=A0A6A4BJ46_9STRA|nr:hypothetical protein PF001_g27492 [Phytophthora fragariae]